MRDRFGAVIPDELRSGNILGQADTATHFASCIDRGLLPFTTNSAC